MRLLIWIFEILAAYWLLRSLWGTFAGSSRQIPSRPSENPFSSQHAAAPSPRIAGEMKKDPQCGTYVSTELSVKLRHRDQELHFCSRECQQAFLQTQSAKSA
ncbi:MAG: YHS domain-containing protein [Acidobacteria bacterium]|nr:YHS domain-containing protein [Acidobacteriota bacterium]